VAKEQGVWHPLFDHAVSVRTSTWDLSTSNVTSAPIVGGGYGPATPHGYGACYGIVDDEINFHLSAMRTSPVADVFRFEAALRGALEDMFATLRGAGKL
jgi:hypothetical protein